MLYLPYSIIKVLTCVKFSPDIQKADTTHTHTETDSLPEATLLFFQKEYDR